MWKLCLLGVFIYVYRTVVFSLQSKYQNLVSSLVECHTSICHIIRGTFFTECAKNEGKLANFVHSNIFLNLSVLIP